MAGLQHEASGTAWAGFNANPRESTRICSAAAFRLVAGGAIREDSPDLRRFVFPTKNARAPFERYQHQSIEKTRAGISRR